MNTGTVIDDRYRLRGVIGRGAMAEVHVATDLRLERTVALKIARSEQTSGAERNQHEMRTLASLQHPNVVRMLDAGHWDGVDYLVLEHVNGPSLAVRLREGPLPMDAVARIARETASALAYLHERGIVHRDVKPANILLDSAGHAHVADFGTAWQPDGPRLTATGQTIGTASYLSPEQVRGYGIGPASDIYALGLVLLECLTGRREYPGTPAEAALARLSRPPAIDPDLPEVWAQRLRDMTALDTADRPCAATVAAWFASGEPAPTLVLPITPAIDSIDDGQSEPATEPIEPLEPLEGALAPTWLRGGAGKTAAAATAAAIAVVGVVSAATAGSAHHHAPAQGTATSGTVNSNTRGADTPPPATPTPSPSKTAPAPAPAHAPAPAQHAKKHDHHGRGG